MWKPWAVVRGAPGPRAPGPPPVLARFRRLDEAVRCLEEQPCADDRAVVDLRRWCARCSHDLLLHTHHRDATDCSGCACPGFRRPWRDPARERPG